MRIFYLKKTDVPYLGSMMTVSEDGGVREMKGYDQNGSPLTFLQPSSPKLGIMGYAESQNRQGVTLGDYAKEVIGEKSYAKIKDVRMGEEDCCEYIVYANPKKNSQSYKHMRGGMPVYGMEDSVRYYSATLKKPMLSIGQKLYDMQYGPVTVRSVTVLGAGNFDKVTVSTSNGIQTWDINDALDNFLFLSEGDAKKAALDMPTYPEVLGRSGGWVGKDPLTVDGAVYAPYRQWALEQILKNPNA